MLFDLTRYRHLFFDFDGVVANSMERNYRAWNAVMSQVGIDVERNEYFQLEGMSGKKVALTLIERNKPSRIIDVDEIVSLKEREFLSHQIDCIYPEMTLLLGALQSDGYVLTVVTGASSIRLDNMLGFGSIKPYFSHIITSEMYTNGKPNPEPYEKALEINNANTREAIVIENAPLGIESAKKAGLLCIALETTLGREYLCSADYIVKDHQQLIKLLGINCAFS